MGKIYNEVVIDMNPESSSYGETLHEDSFEYEGPMALAVVLDTGEDWYHGNTNLGEYSSHKGPYNVGGNQYYVMFTGEGVDWGGAGGKPKAVVISSGGEIIDWRFKGAMHDNYDQARDFASAMVEGAGVPTADEQIEQMEGEEAKTAPDINYSDFSRYIDQYTGDVSDKGGMMQYLKTLPQFENSTPAELEEAIAKLPKLHIGATAEKEARESAYGDIYGVQQQFGTERARAQSSIGQSGVINPYSSSFGGVDKTFAEGLYQQTSDATSKMKDNYGLGGDEEQEFANWLANW